MRRLLHPRGPTGAAAPQHRFRNRRHLLRRSAECRSSAIPSASPPATRRPRPRPTNACLGHLPAAASVRLRRANRRARPSGPQEGPCAARVAPAERELQDATRRTRTKRPTQSASSRALDKVCLRKSRESCVSFSGWTHTLYNEQRNAADK